jgi:hypothetical protein
VKKLSVSPTSTAASLGGGIGVELVAGDLAVSQSEGVSAAVVDGTALGQLVALASA